jgi:hypothetical protein
VFHHHTNTRIHEYTNTQNFLKVKATRPMNQRSLREVRTYSAQSMELRFCTGEHFILHFGQNSDQFFLEEAFVSNIWDAVKVQNERVREIIPGSSYSLTDRRSSPTEPCSSNPRSRARQHLCTGEENQNKRATSSLVLKEMVIPLYFYSYLSKNLEKMRAF